MVTADDKSNSSGTPHPVHYAQSGIVRWGNSSPTEFHGFHTFAQWTRGCNPNCMGSGGNIVTMLGPDPSGVATYSAFLKSSTQTIVMKVGSQIVGETGYNPADVWDSRWQAEYFGEVYHHESDLMGKDSNRLKVTNIQRYESDGSINFVANLNYDNGTAKYCSGGNVKLSTLSHRRLRTWCGRAGHEALDRPHLARLIHAKAKSSYIRTAA